MSKPTFRAVSDNERRNAQPSADRPPTKQENPNPNTNSGYPAGGKDLPQGKDAYGRDRKTQQQAGKRPATGSHRNR